MQVDPILSTVKPARITSHAAHKADIPRCTTDTAANLFPARTRPRSTRAPSSFSRRAGPSSLRKYISSLSETADGSEEKSSADPASSKPWLSNDPSSSPKAKEKESPQPSPIPRRSSLNSAYASDIWRIQAQSERRRNEALKKALADERSARRAQNEIIQSLEEQVNNLRASQCQGRCDTQSLYSSSTASRKLRWRQKVRMMRDDLREHRVTRRIRKGLWGSEGSQSSALTRPGPPKRVFLSSTMG